MVTNLPNFLIIGAMKAGTTSLYRFLGEHHDIYMSPIKEPGFFSLVNGFPDYFGPISGKLSRIDAEAHIIFSYRGKTVRQGIQN